jgi:phage gp36-like protein
MAYSTLDDIKAHIPEENLIQLTDDENLGTINQTRIDEAIEYADEIINGYLRGRYTLPLSPVPGLITKLSVDLAIFHLYSRRLELEMPESMMQRYKNAIKLLEQIQRGLITLGVDSDVTPEPGEYKTSKTSNDRIFTEEVWDKY